jgi:hypothetical protein
VSRETAISGIKVISEKRRAIAGEPLAFVLAAERKFRRKAASRD